MAGVQAGRRVPSSKTVILDDPPNPEQVPESTKGLKESNSKTVQQPSPPPPPEILIVEEEDDEEVNEVGDDGDTFQGPQFSTTTFLKEDKPEKKPCCSKWADPTYEYFDEYSNIQVGTEFDTCITGFHTEKDPENFYYIVDLDSYEYHKIVFDKFLNSILQSEVFRFSILCLVVVNAILIGVNTNTGIVERNKYIFQIFDQVSLAVFLFEIALKWMYDFRLFWMVWWNVLDFGIILLMATTQLIPTLGASRQVISMIRVIRAFRTLRSVSSLTSLKVVTHTIVRSIGDMINILFVLIMFMCVMAIAGVTIFDHPVLARTKRFLSTFDAWFVLFVCLTEDGWVAILDEFRSSAPLNEDSPQDEKYEDKYKRKYFPLISLYLMIGVAIGAFILANLIIAVVVANLELSMKEIRAENLLTGNPLDNYGKYSAPTVEILPVYSIFAQDNTPLMAQRPLRIPNLRKVSLRRIQAYISLVVALEQNMLEYSIIEKDMERVMSVILEIMKQTKDHDPEKKREEFTEGVKIMEEITDLKKVPSKLPSQTVSRMILNEELKKARKNLQQGVKGRRSDGNSTVTTDGTTVE